MNWGTIVYPIMLLMMYALTYAALYLLFPLFFKQKRAAPTQRSIISVGIIMLLSLLVYAITRSITDEQVANRLLHMFGGGFLAFITCYFAARDSGVAITKFQFLVFSLLLATAMGVGNELVEFLIQELTGVAFTDSLTDTWLDLLSNTIGALLAGACFTPFFNVPPVGIEPTSRP